MATLELARHLSFAGNLNTLSCFYSNILQHYYSYSEDAFTTHHLVTIGIDFITKEVILPNEVVSAKIWDTAGQERFRTITHTFYRQAEGVMLVFDVTDRGTYDSVHSWISSIHEHADERVVKYLIGNKIDMKGAREVSKEEGERMARDYQMKYVETSAKEAINVKETVEAIVKDVRANSTKTEEMVRLTASAAVKRSKKGKHSGKGGGSCCTIF